MVAQNIQAKNPLIKLIFLSILFPAQLYGRGVKTEGSLTFVDIIRGYRTKSGISKLKSDFDARSNALRQLDESRFPGSLSLETKTEILTERPISQNKFEVLLKKKIILGRDNARIAKRYQAEGHAQYMSKINELGEGEVSLGKVYINLSYQRAALAEITRLLEALSPILEKLGKASKLGTVGGYTALKAQLYFESIKAEKMQFQHSIALLLALMRAETGIELSPQSVDLEVTPLGVNLAALNPDSSPLKQESHLRRDAIVEQISQVGSGFEINAGVGAAYSQESKETSIMIEIGIPLGTQYSVAAEISVLQAEKDLIEAEAEIKVMQMMSKVHVAILQVERLKQNLVIHSQRAESLENLLKEASRSVRSGQGDVLELLEMNKELYEVRIKLLGVAESLQVQILETKYMMTGDVL